MFKPGPARPLLLVLLAPPGCLEGGQIGAADPGVSTGASTGGAPTTSDLPTTGASSGAPGSTSSSTATNTDGTGEEPASTASGPGEAGDGPVCGDGVVDAGEACDDGLAGNDDSRYCTADCSLNVCGDGKLFVGWELCDDGAANSDQYGSLCGSQCLPGERCGDHELQPEFETCDLGLDNGGPDGDEQGILCDASCRAQQLRGFVTSASFHGDLGGFFGADQKCRDAAEAAGLAEPGRFHALLSSGTVDAAERFAAVAPLPYVLVTGAKFADSFAALIAAGPLGEGISATETGAALYQANVASNTAPGGLRYSPDWHCQGWTSADEMYMARVGINAMPIDAPEWSAWQDAQAWLGATEWTCNKLEFHLYCLEI